MPAMVLPVSAIQEQFHETADDVAIQVSVPHDFEHVSVDLNLPLSLSDQKIVHLNLPLPISDQKTVPLNLPLPLPPTQFCSLPNSAYSSPRFSTAVLKKKVKGSSSRGHSHLILGQKLHLNRSKSCGEGRASVPPDDFEIWQPKPGTLVIPCKYNNRSSETENSNKDCHRIREEAGHCGEQFKCRALCLFLPSFGKGKAAERARKIEEERDIGKVISRTVSLEKFECGSWASSSSAIFHEDHESTSLYFDLPMELIRNSVGAQTPVKAGFVFDKNGKAKAEKCDESPRLRIAREEFNALVEAQGA